MATTIPGVELCFAVGKKYNVVVESLSHVQLFAILWTVAHQVPQFMEFSRQEYWSELPFPTPEDLPDPETEPTSAAFAGRFVTPVPPGKSIWVNIKDYLFFLISLSGNCVKWQLYCGVYKVRDFFKV